jgi:hypothetical protein
MTTNFHDDAELYGQELIDGVRRWVQPDIAGIEQRLQETERTLKQQRVEKALNDDPITSGRWKKVNVDPEFLSWLNTPYELTNERRLDILCRHEYYGNADGVVAMFRSWIISTTMPNRIDTKPLAYETARPTAAPSGSNRRFTRQQIAEFYEDCRKGKYLKKETERARTEADILAAARENRIVDPPMKLSRGHAV